MKKNVSKYDFTDAFASSSERKEQFSYSALQALYDYLIEYEEDTGEEIEFDMIALCCEFSEYEDIEEIIGVYPDIESVDDLRDHTQIIEFGGGIIVQAF